MMKRVDILSSSCTHLYQTYKILVALVWTTKGTPEKHTICYWIFTDRTTVPGLAVFEMFYTSLFWGVVWEMQGVGGVKSLIKECKQRLIDCLRQDWHSALESHDFYNVYSNFNHSLVHSPYLSLLNNILCEGHLLRSELECLLWNVIICSIDPLLMTKV